MKKYYIYLLLFLIFCIFSKKIFSQNKMFFSENKGQWHENILFKTSVGNTNLFLEKNAFTFDMNNIEHHRCEKNGHDCKDRKDDFSKKKFKGHSYKLIFDKANENIKIKGKNPAKNYENYFIGSDKTKWANYVKRYPTVYYENIYENIDLQVYSQNINFKYDFILKPNANIKNIALIYKGLDEIKLEKENLILKTSIGEMIELKPFSYQIINNDTIPIVCKFHLEKNKLTFKIEQEYDKNYTLIIDPILVFSTFSGSTSSNWGFTATYDYIGNVYSGGVVSGQGYPVSPGAYDISYELYWDIAIIKYNSIGTERIYATYLGGDANDYPHSLVVDSQNDLYIYGASSSLDFPMKENSYDSTFEGSSSLNNMDIYIAKLSEDGSSLLASTYFGGNQDDGYNDHSSNLNKNYGDQHRGEIIIDKEDNVYISSCTESNDIILNNAYQSIFNGEMDGLLLKFNSDLSELLWGTYLGGNNNDALYSIDIDSNNDIYVAGGTESNNILMSNSAYNNINNGDIDAFIYKFSQDGEFLKSTFFGSSAYDQAYFVKLDKDDNVYIAGQTEASDMTLVYNVDYFTSNSGQFIAKLNPDLTTLIYSTVFGNASGTYNISPVAFNVDICNRTYLSGFGQTEGMEITSDAFQTTTDNSDFYVMVLSDDVSTLEYATYFGGSAYDHVDGGTSRFDKKGNIYQSICTGSNNLPITDGAWSESNNSTNNNALFRLNLEPNISIADFIPQYDFSNEIHFENISLGTGFIWDFGDGSSISYEENPNHTFTEAGIYNVQLIAINEESCNISDTIIKQIEIILPQIEIDLELIKTSCYGVCDGKIILEISGGVAPFQVFATALGSEIENFFTENQDTIVNLDTISDENFFLANYNEYNNTFFIENLCANEYQIYVYDSNNDFKMITIEITEPNELSLQIWEDYTLCLGGINIVDYIYGGTSPFGITWIDENDEIFFSDNSQVFLQNGTYEIFINDANNCKDTAEITFIESPSLAIELVNKIDNNCGNDCIGEAEIIASGGNGNYFYYWSNENYGNYQTGLCPGIYTITVFEENFCPNSLEIEINENFSVRFQITNHQNVSCNGLEDGSFDVEILNGLEPFIYTLNDSIIYDLSNINNLNAGIYNFTITDANNCFSSKTIVITEPQELNILDENKILCFGENINIVNYIYGGKSPFEISWKNENNESFFSDNNQVFLEGGTYKVSINDANNCKDTAEIILIELPYLDIELIDKIDDSFGNPCIGEVEVLATGGLGNYIYIWNNGSYGNYQTELCAGNYNLSVIDENNCENSLGIEINEVCVLNFEIINIQNISCNGSENGSFDVEILSGLEPFNYTLNDDIIPDLLNINNLNAGIYNLKIEDANHCSSSKKIEITEPEELNLEIDENYILCFGDSISVNSNIYGGNNPFEISWKNENNEIFFSDNSQIFLKSGSYEIFINDANNCKDTAEITLTESEFLDIELIDKVNNNCDNNCIGEAEIIANGGVGNYIYFWNNGYYGNYQSGLCTGNYNIIVIDENNCTNNLSIEIKEDSMLNFQITNYENLNCNGLENGRFDLEIIGGLEPFTFSLNNSVIPFSTNINNLDAGIYNLKITDANNCFSSETITITEPEMLNIEMEFLQEISCFNEMASIKANVTGGTPPYEYFWNNLENTTNIVNALSAGTYSLNITDANNCEIFKEFEILQPEILSADIENVQHNICFGDSLGFINLEIFGGTPEYSFLWSNGDTTIFIDSLNAGIYSVEVYDENNCNTFFEIEINEPNRLIFNNITTNNISCYGENDGFISVNLNGGILPYNYFLNEIDFQDENFFENLYTGTYNLEVFDANNCKISQEVFLDEPDVLNIENIENVELNCFGDSISVNFNVNGGTPEYNYFLDTLSNQIETNLINDLFAGNYEIIVIDENQCQISTKFEITHADSFSLENSVFHNPCFGDNLASINLEVFGGNPEYNFLWNNGDTTNFINGLATGTYNCLIKDMKNCEINYSMEILQASEIILNFNKRDMLCFGINDAFINIEVSGGTGDFDYNWGNNISYNNLANNLSDGIYNVTVTDENHCQKSLEIEILPPPEIMNTNFNQPNEILCNGDSTRVDLTTTGGIPPYEYFWTKLSNTNSFVENLYAGIHEVIITDKNNCKEFINFTIFSPEILILDGEIKEATCKSACNGELNLQVSGGTKPYSYFLNEIPTNILIEDLCLGEYEISVRDANNCEIQDSFKINFSEDTLKLNIFSDIDTIYKGQSLQLHSEINGSFKNILWNNIETLNSYEIPNPIAKPVKNTIYTATLIDLDGCGYMDKLEIFVKNLKCDEPFIFVPNAFSPNGDGKNDILYVQSDIVEEIYFAIYNRWGNLLFETNDIKKGWDGKFNEEKVEASVLVYYIKAKCLNKETFIKKGNITIIR